MIPNNSFSPFLTISLRRAGQYFSHAVFSILCHVFGQLVFLHVSLYVAPSSLFRSASASSPRNPHLSDFAQMWLRFRLKQWPNHFSLLFYRNVSTGFTYASFMMSSFMMCSNLVFPLAHCNILISAEFSLSSSFFFTAQHSEPYIIAGLTIVLKTLSFYSTGIFLSHINPDTSFHSIHPILILLLTSACEPPSLVNSDPRYLKDGTVGSSASTIFTVVSVSFVGLGKYSVFVLLIFSPCLSSTTLHVSMSSSTSSRVIAHHQVVSEHHHLPLSVQASAPLPPFASIGKSSGTHALFLSIFDSCFLISVSFTDGIAPCTGSVNSSSSLSFSTFSRVSNDYFHLVFIRQN